MVLRVIFYANNSAASDPASTHQTQLVITALVLMRLFAEFLDLMSFHVLFSSEVQSLMTNSRMSDIELINPFLGMLIELQALELKKTKVDLKNVNMGKNIK